MTYSIDRMYLTTDKKKIIKNNSCFGQAVMSRMKLCIKKNKKTLVTSSQGPLNVLSIPGWEWSGSSHYLQNALMVMRLTQPLTAKS